jgi:regulatory protein
MTPLPSLRDRALGLLARREHTRAELQRKLTPHTEDPAELSDLLDELANRGWLSDTRFAEALVHDKQAKFGAVRLAYELRERGVPDAVIRNQLAELKDSEFDRARQVWQSKFGTPPEDAKARAKQIRFLQSRGFSLEVISKVVRGASED